MPILETSSLVVFTIDGQSFGAALSRVERVVSASRITPFPQAPKMVCGMINVEGRVIPVIHMRRHLGLPDRELVPEDKFLIVNLSRGLAALWVDAVTEVIPYTKDEAMAGKDILAENPLVGAVLKRKAGLILVQDLSRGFEGMG